MFCRCRRTVLQTNGERIKGVDIQKHQKLEKMPPKREGIFEWYFKNEYNSLEGIGGVVQVQFKIDHCHLTLSNL
jgi:hypothetical protein